MYADVAARHERDGAHEAEADHEDGVGQGGPPLAEAEGVLLNVHVLAPA